MQLRVHVRKVKVDLPLINGMYEIVGEKNSIWHGIMNNLHVFFLFFPSLTTNVFNDSWIILLHAWLKFSNDYASTKIFNEKKEKKK